MAIGSFVKWAESQRQQQLRIGQKIEMEHTDNPTEAREIAKDHLHEFKDYYTRLTKMEREAKKELQTKKGFVEYFREKAAGLEQLPAQLVKPELERRTDEAITGMLDAGTISSEQAEKLRAHTLAAMAPVQQSIESQAVRREAGERTLSPTTIGSTAAAVGIGTAFPIAFNRAHRLFNAKAERMPWKDALKFQFLPSVIPWTAGFEGLSHALAPMSDPLYQRGERGYLKSMSESFGGAQEGLAERGAEARQRLGLLGVPVQAFHGVMNPLASTANLGRQVKRTMFGTPSDDLLREAVERVAQANGGNRGV